MGKIDIIKKLQSQGSWAYKVGKLICKEDTFFCGD